MVSEGENVRRWAYLLVVIFALQISGLRALCAPRIGRSHACCPEAPKPTLPVPASIPDCCLGTVLNYQGSITEGQNVDRYSDLTVQVGSVIVPSPVPLVASGAPRRQAVLPSVSPPQSPLSQSCLLLI